MQWTLICTATLLPGILATGTLRQRDNNEISQAFTMKRILDEVCGGYSKCAGLDCCNTSDGCCPASASQPLWCCSDSTDDDNTISTGVSVDLEAGSSNNGLAASASATLEIDTDSSSSASLNATSNSTDASSSDESASNGTSTAQSTCIASFIVAIIAAYTTFF